MYINEKRNSKAIEELYKFLNDESHGSLCILYGEGKTCTIQNITRTLTKKKIRTYTILELTDRLAYEIRHQGNLAECLLKDEYDIYIVENIETLNKKTNTERHMIMDALLCLTKKEKKVVFVSNARIDEVIYRTTSFIELYIYLPKSSGKVARVYSTYLGIRMPVLIRSVLKYRFPDFISLGQFLKRISVTKKYS